LVADEINEICATVKNNGTADAGEFNVSFDVGVFSEEVHVDGLAVGEDKTVCVNDTTLRTAGENLTITVTADSDAEVEESNETNNALSVVETVVAGPQPDLIVTEINLTSGALFANQSNEICATVKNNGTADAGAFNVSFDAGVFSEEVRVGGLTAGEETTVCVTDPTLRTAGENLTITVTADSDAEVEESNETNNVLTLVAGVVLSVEYNFTIDFFTGYNMVGIPVNDVAVTNASTLIAKIGPNCTEVFKWDKDTQMWRSYIPGMPAIFDFDIEGGDGCFVTMVDTATVIFTGEGWESPFTISLATGYDMISIPVNDVAVINASTLIAKIGSNCTEVFKWDKDTQMWRSYIPGMPAIFDFDIEGGDGCFVTMIGSEDVAFEGDAWSN